MLLYAEKTHIPLGPYIRRVTSAGTDFFIIRYPRVLLKASLTYTLTRGLTRQRSRFSPGWQLVPCSFPLPYFVFTSGLCWTDVGLGSLFNAHSAKALGFDVLGQTEHGGNASATVTIMTTETQESFLALFCFSWFRVPVLCFFCLEVNSIQRHDLRDHELLPIHTRGQPVCGSSCWTLESVCFPWGRVFSACDASFQMGNNA